MCGQLPPNHSRSMTATDAPSSRALWLAASPAGPAPMIAKSKVSMVTSEVVGWNDDGTTSSAIPPVTSLSARFVEEHRGGDRDVETVGDTEHGQSDRLDIRTRPRAGETIR